MEKKIKKCFIRQILVYLKEKEDKKFLQLMKLDLFMFLQKKHFTKTKINLEKNIEFQFEFLSSILEIDDHKDYEYISNLLKTNIPKKYKLFLP